MCKNEEGIIYILEEGEAAHPENAPVVCVTSPGLVPGYTLKTLFKYITLKPEER